MRQPGSRRAATALALGLVCLACYGRFVSLGLVGHDSYPLIAASRVHSLADAAGTFTERLMDGRFDQDFYRPVLNLSVALDELVSGLDPRGYQLASVLWLFAAALALHALVYRMSREDGRAALVAALVYVLSAVHGAVVPVLARRPELLCTLFLALALRAEVVAARRGGRSLAPAFFALLAMGAKESGFIAVPLVAAASALYRPPSSGPGAVVRAVAPVVGAGVLAFALRWLVLGGIGGPPGAGTAPVALFVSFAAVLLPQPFAADGSGGFAFALAGILAAALLVGLLRARLPAGSGAALTLALAWSVSAAALYAASGQLQPWYLALPWAGVAMTLGVAASALVHWFGTMRGAARAAPALGLAALLVWLGWQARDSFLLRDYDEWRRADAELRGALDDLTLRLAAAAPGTSLHTRPIATWIEPAPGRPGIPGVAVISDYGLQAFVELRFPDRPARVLGPGVEGRAEPAGVVTIVPVWK